MTFWTGCHSLHASIFCRCHSPLPYVVVGHCKTVYFAILNRTVLHHWPRQPQLLWAVDIALHIVYCIHALRKNNNIVIMPTRDVLLCHFCKMLLTVSIRGILLSLMYSWYYSIHLHRWIEFRLAYWPQSTQNGWFCLVHRALTNIQEDHCL